MRYEALGLLKEQIKAAEGDIAALDTQILDCDGDQVAIPILRAAQEGYHDLIRRLSYAVEALK